jgi:hypothetical protein
VKPGDLVEIIDYGGYYSCEPPRIGMIVGSISVWSDTIFPTLVDGEIKYLAIHELRLVNLDDAGYDNTKEKE